MVSGWSKKKHMKSGLELWLNASSRRGGELEPAEKESKNTHKLDAGALEQIAREMADALIKNPRLMDELSARLPAEFSFVLRQLPHDQEAMTAFVKAIHPLLEKERRFGEILKEGDKIELFLELMDKPEFTDWIVQAITGKDAAEILESGIPAWLAKSQQGADLLEQRKFEESKALLQEALEECDSQRPNSLWSFAILRALSVACGGAGDVERLEPLLHRWIESAEGKLGSWHPELAYPYSMMALVREEQGNVPEAETLYKRAVSILERAGTADEEDLLNAEHELAFFYFRQKRWDEARPLLLAVLSSRERQNQPDEETLEYVEALAVVNAEQENFGENEAYCRRLLAWCEAHPDQSDYAWFSMGLLACAFMAVGKSGEAAVVFESMLEKMQSVFVDDNDRMRLVLESYIKLLKSNGREREASLLSAQAQRLLYQVIEIHTQTDEVTSDELPIEIVAQCYFRLARNDAADAWQFMESSERSSKLRRTLVESLRDYFVNTDFLKICTDFKEIEDEFQEYIECASELHGLEVIFQFREFSDKGGFLQVLGKLQRAIQLSDSGRNQEAEELYQESLTESVRFPRSDLKRYVKEIFVDYLQNSGQSERAQELREEEI
jgi:tetratricopeptide (TPR) repeat protein